jgi:hypothetical protein
MNAFQQLPVNKFAKPKLITAPGNQRADRNDERRFPLTWCISFKPRNLVCRQNRRMDSMLAVPAKPLRLRFTPIGGRRHHA